MKIKALCVVVLMGMCCLPWTGFGEDIAELRQKAEQGDVTAQCNLGVCYFTGNGIPQDHTEAVKWYRLAAEQKDEKAQHNLGICYAKGQGCARDYVQAYVWFNIAAAAGSEKSKVWRENLLKRMTPAQVEEGQRLSRDYAKFIK